MTQYKVNKAYPALVRLSECRLPVKKARDLYKMTKRAEEHFRFAVTEEQKYVAEFGGKENSNGTITFESPELFGKFQEKAVELSESVIEWDVDPIVITDSDIGGQTISSSDILNLEGFVTFE